MLTSSFEKSGLSAQTKSVSLMNTDYLREENILLKKYLKRVESLDDEQENTQKKSRTKRRLSVLKTGSQKVRLKTLNNAMKMKCLSAEFDHEKALSERNVKLSFEKVKEKEIDLKVIESKMKELKRTAYDFKKQLIDDKQSNQSSSTVTEKVIYYLETMLKQKKSLLTKLNVKVEGIKTSSKKLMNFIKDKSNNDDILSPIDFQQLQIENKQHQNVILTKNKKLLKVKQTSSTLLLRLNKLQDELQLVCSENEVKVKELEKLKSITTKTKVERTIVEEEVSELEKLKVELNKYSKKDGNESTISEYILCKKQLKDVKQINKNIEKKIEIASI